MTDPIDIAEGYSAEPYGDGYIICHSGGGRAVAQLDMAAAVREIARLRAELAETHDLARDQFDLRAEQRDDRDSLRAAISAAQVPQPAAHTYEPVEGAVWGLWGDPGVSLIQRGCEDDRIARKGGERLYRRVAAAPGASPPPAALAVPDGWTVRDRSDLEAGAIDLTSPTTGRVVLLPAHRDAHSRTLYDLAAAMLAASQESATTRGRG